ncbi:MAG: hypothetical protein SOU19_00080 [Candidatus Caccosoma sp.]|nr:hypothetical protein [Candidatus Caccosoma sp.]
MKKNKVLFAFTSILSIALIASCDSAEKKIDYQDGNAIVTATKDKTKADLVELSNKDIFGATASASVEGKVDLNFKNTILGQTIEMGVKANVKAEAEAQTNQDLAGLRKYENGNADISNCESYTKAMVSGQYEVSGIPETTSSTDSSTSSEPTKIELIAEAYQKGATSTTRTTKNGETTTNSSTMEQKEINEYAKSFITFLKDTTINDEKTSDLPVEIDLSTFEEAAKKIEAFKNKEITAEELVNYIDQNVFNGELFKNATEKDKQYVIDLVNSYDKYDYTKYVTFTKATTKNQLVLKSSFKYEDWKTSFTNVCEELSKTYADSAYAKMVNETIIPSLPSTFVFNYSLYIADKGKGAISGADFEFVIKGQAKIPSEISTLADSSIIAMLAGGTLTYDVSLKGNFNLSYGDTAVTVKTLEN